MPVSYTHLDVYKRQLLKRTEVPILIVECGFLSNQEEAEKLASEDYQKELAKAIANGNESCLKD